MTAVWFAGSMILASLLDLAGAPDGRCGRGANRGRPIPIIGEGGRLALAPAEIDWIEAEGEGSRIFTRDGSRRVRCILADLEKALLEHEFLCVSPSVLVNVRRIRDLRLAGPRRRRVVLEGGKSWLCGFPFTLPLDQIWRERDRRGRPADPLRGIGNRVTPGL